MRLIAVALRWLYRHLLAFVVIVGLLFAAYLVQQALADRSSVDQVLSPLRSVLVSLESFLADEQSNLDARVKHLQRQPPARNAIRARLDAIEEELARSRPFKPLLPPVWRPGELFDAFIEKGKEELRLSILEQERQLLEAVLTGVDYRSLHEQLADAVREQDAAEALQRANEAEQSQLKHDEWLTFWIPGTDPHRRLSELKVKRLELDRRAGDAKAKVETIRETLRLIGRRAPSSEPGPRPVEAILGPLRAQKAQLEWQQAENWVHKALALLEESGAVRAALMVMVGVVLSPLLVKSLAYYVVAPLATRRPPIRLLPDVKGRIAAPAAAALPGAARRPVSAVSQALRLSPAEELLIHPEYLQSAPDDDHKGTRWLFSRAFPFASIAAGLFALVRLSSEVEKEYVISATKDPLGEIGILTIPSGSALAVQPRSLVGVLQRRQHPLRITSHWRLASLKAWLTLQLRYLVFHGPVTLLVKGCRGVRVEHAGAGRSINQAATIGFGANLDYSVSRCEVFSAYLLGKRELFNDSFSGGPGDYVYEEMPFAGKKSGILGRGLEGILDTILKVFGI